MNCVRLLTRLLPVAFEASQSQVFEPTLFWKNTLPGSDAAASDVSAGASSFSFLSSFVRRSHAVLMRSASPIGE